MFHLHLHESKDGTKLTNRPYTDSGFVVKIKELDMAKQMAHDIVEQSENVVLVQVFKEGHANPVYSGPGTI